MVFTHVLISTVVLCYFRYKVKTPSIKYRLGDEGIERSPVEKALDKKLDVN